MLFILIRNDVGCKRVLVSGRQNGDDNWNIYYSRKPAVLCGLIRWNWKSINCQINFFVQLCIAVELQRLCSNRTFITTAILNGLPNYCANFHISHVGQHVTSNCFAKIFCLHMAINCENKMVMNTKNLTAFFLCKELNREPVDCSCAKHWFMIVTKINFINNRQHY